MNLFKSFNQFLLAITICLCVQDIHGQFMMIPEYCPKIVKIISEKKLIDQSLTEIFGYFQREKLKSASNKVEEIEQIRIRFCRAYVQNLISIEEEIDYFSEKGMCKAQSNKDLVNQLKLSREKLVSEYGSKFDCKAEQKIIKAEANMTKAKEKERIKPSCLHKIKVFQQLVKTLDDQLDRIHESQRNAKRSFEVELLNPSRPGSPDENHRATEEIQRRMQAMADEDSLAFCKNFELFKAKFTPFLDQFRPDGFCGKEIDKAVAANAVIEISGFSSKYANRVDCSVYLKTK